MIRQTDIPNVQKGQRIDANLLNQVIKGANGARMTTGDGAVEVQKIGGSIGFSIPGITPISDRNCVVKIYAPNPDDEDEVPLAGGYYYGVIYSQPLIIASVLYDGVTQPSPDVINCIILNTMEWGFGTHNLEDETPAIGQKIGFTEGGTILVGVTIGGVLQGGLLRVTLSVDGGLSGDDTTQCSYTYEVTDPTSMSVLGTFVMPETGRPTLGSLGAAGIGIWDMIAGTLVLAYEPPDVDVCEEEG